MSVSSILAFVIAGAAAKVKSVQVARRSQDKRVAELEARIAELEDAIASANAQARRDQELIDIWRERALYAEAPIGALVPAGPDFRPPQIALQQAEQQQAAALRQQQMLAAQYNAQAAMNAQNYYSGAQNGLAQLGQAQHPQGLGQPMGLLGAQMIDAELWCNCVPALHDMFLRGDGG